MKKVLERSYSIHDVEKVANELKALLSISKVMTFSGSLGAGKTTLVQALLRSCGVNDVVTSPTFTYVNCYTNGKGEAFYHYDCYRVASQEAFVDAGLDEFLFAPHSWAFVEWPEVIDPLLKGAVCRVTLDYDGLEKRHLVAVVE